MRSGRSRARAGAGCALLIATLTACARAPGPGAAGAPRATHGVAVGEVTDRRAVVWSRADRAGRMRVSLFEAEGAATTAGPGGEVEVGPDTDFTGRIAVEGLRPATRYRVEVSFAAPGGRPGPPATAAFRSAPAPGVAAPVRLAWGGDVAGQNVCRDAREGFPILAQVIAVQPDVFVGLGDWIYADDVCRADGRYGNEQVPGAFGPAADLDGFRAHWAYTRGDAGLRALLATTPWVAVWDDHEVVNDFGPHTDTRDDPPYRSGLPLMPLGRRAFREWNPIAPRAPLHRSLRWGRHLELFVLDTRQFRDPNFTPDVGPLPKTMLGPEQRRWLEQRVAASDATWKVIVSSVPLAVPTGSASGRDGWADYDGDTGFERELREVLAAFEGSGVRNLVWITTDVHFAAAFRHAPFGDAPGFRFLEIATGPMNAGLFPNLRFDETLGTRRLFYYAPPRADRITSFAAARRWFNFGLLDIGADGQLAASIVNGEGQTVFRLTLAPH